MTLTVAFIGTGANPDDPDREGFAMAYRHANAYRAIDGVELVACADIVPENAATFAETFDVPHVYEDYEEMLTETEPDVVSVCVPPKAHAEVVMGAARTGVPEAIHCEKPMAATWGDAREMVEVCEEHDVRLTVNHQRRFGKPFQRAKSLLDDGEIGELVRIEFTEDNIFDAGSHLFDLSGYFTNQAGALWVLAALDYREENVWFGSHNENQALVQWQYETGAFGLASTGFGDDFVGCFLRLRGTGGTIEIGVHDGPTLRIKRDADDDWEVLDTDGETIHRPPAPGLLTVAVQKATDRVTGTEGRTKPSYIDRAIADVVRAVREDEPSQLDAHNALQSTELIFAAYESVRRRGRVDFPLDVEDNALEAMVASGALTPEPAEAPADDATTDEAADTDAATGDDAEGESTEATASDD